MTVRLEPELHQRLKVAAAVSGTSMESIVKQALESSLARREKRAKK